MRWIEKAWYRKRLGILVVLWPVSLLFAGLAGLRRFAYRYGMKQSAAVSCPVIVVGNLTVGGNGKTPLVLALTRYLRQYGFKVGVLSRGYGGNNKTFPHTVSEQDSADWVGDEPAMMKRQLTSPLVIDPKRVRGARYLCQHHNVDLIICDDGLQHYGLQRNIEIVVMDGQRRLGNGHLLPMGPLREPLRRLRSVDYVVINGHEAVENEVLMGLVAGQLVNLKQPSNTIAISQFKRDQVHAVAAIGNPQRFFTSLKHKGVELAGCHEFDDHHKFEDSDIPYKTVIMTEKDAIKCQQFAEDDWWYLPVTAQLPVQFTESLVHKIKQIKMN